MPNLNFFDRIVDRDETVLDDLYKTCREKFLLSMQEQFECPKDLAVEFYQTVVLIFYNKVESGWLKDDSVDLHIILNDIARDRWQDFMHYRQSQESLKDYNLLRLILDVSDEVHDNQEIRSLYQALLALGDPHRKTLESMYSYHLSHSRVSLNPHLDNTLTGKKFKSIQRLIRIISRD